MHVVAEDGNVMCSVLGKQLSMKLTRIDCAPKNHQKVCNLKKKKSSNFVGSMPSRNCAPWEITEPLITFFLCLHFLCSKLGIYSSSS